MSQLNDQYSNKAYYQSESIFQNTYFLNRYADKKIKIIVKCTLNYQIICFEQWRK